MTILVLPQLNPLKLEIQTLWNKSSRKTILLEREETEAIIKSLKDNKLV